MKLYFKTRSQARSFANKTNRKAPATKDQSVNKWAVVIK
jgi:hypothetical protein